MAKSEAAANSLGPLAKPSFMENDSMVAKQSSLTQALVQELLHYNPETGALFWRAHPSARVAAEKPFGRLCRLGYRRGKIQYENHSAHRLIWFYVHGAWPKGEIDHINGIRDDNRLCNLRVTTRSANMQNQKRAHIGTRSGLLGAYYNHGKWRAVIQANKKIISLGNYATPEEAHAAYLEGKRKYHTTNTL